MNCRNQNQQKSTFFISLLNKRPEARAKISGSGEYPEIHGCVRFYSTPYGTLVAVEVHGLPMALEPCKDPIFAFHLHDGNTCTGNFRDPFAETMGHYNPEDCPHPYHAGDLPPLFGNHGYAFSVFLTDRFCVREIIGKTIIIHSAPDDFNSQPSGNSGEKIACGVVQSF